MSGNFSYQDYVQNCIPKEKRWRLEKLMDYDNDVDRDLRALAMNITGWEVNLLSPLGITSTEKDDIKDSTSNVVLRRINLLKLWKSKQSYRATYGKFLQALLEGKDSSTAMKLCQMLAARDTEDVDLPTFSSPASTGATRQGEEYPPPPRVSRPTHQVRQSTSLWDKEFSLRLLKLIKYVDQDGEHKELRLLSHITHKWKSIAGYLGFKVPQIETIENLGSSKTPENCLVEVIEHWQTNSIKMEGMYAETWRGLHKLLEDSENAKVALLLEAAINADCSSVRGNYTEKESHLLPPGVSTGSNGHQHHSNEPASHNGASANRTASKSPSGKRKKFNFEELAEWLDQEGVNPHDIKIFKESETNERQFLKLDPFSLTDKLKDISEATKNDIPDLQDTLRQLNQP